MQCCQLITVVILAVTLSPNNQTELHGIAYVLLYRPTRSSRNYAVHVEHRFWVIPDRRAYKKFYDWWFCYVLVTSWLCDDMTAWRDDRVMSWPAAVEWYVLSELATAKYQPDQLGLVSIQFQFLFSHPPLEVCENRMDNGLVEKPTVPLQMPPPVQPAP